MINEFCLIFSWAWASGDGWLLAWLLATPPNGELARRLKTHKMHIKQKNQCGHNFIYFHKNTLLIFLFYIFTALHQKFMYNCQVREKYLHVHFFQFHFDEWLVRLRHKGVKKRQLWTQRKQVIDRWLLNSIIILVGRTVRGNQCKEGLKLHLTCISDAVHYPPNS